MHRRSATIRLQVGDPVMTTNQALIGAVAAVPSWRTSSLRSVLVEVRVQIAAAEQVAVLVEQDQLLERVLHLTPAQISQCLGSSSAPRGTDTK